MGSDLGYLPVLIDIGYIVIYTPSQVGRSTYIPQSCEKKVVLSKQPGQDGGKVIKRAYYVNLTGTVGTAHDFIFSTFLQQTFV